MKTSKPRQIKAWAVICPAGGYVWAFESMDAANEAAKLHDDQNHGTHKISRCLITLAPKKKGKK